MALLVALQAASPRLAAAERRLPAGAEMPVRLGGGPSWSQGQTVVRVTATVEQNVRSGSVVVIPKGSLLRGQVVQPPVTGRQDSAQVVVEFRELVVGRTAYRVAAAPVTVPVSVTRTPLYCGTPTLHGGQPFKLGEHLEFSLRAGARSTLRLSKPLVLD